MNSAGKSAGWIVAGVLLAVAAAALGWGYHQSRKVAELSAELADVQLAQAQVVDPERLAEVEREAAELARKLADAERRLREIEGDKAGEAAPEEITAGDALQKMFQSFAEKAEEDDGDSGGGNPFLKMYEGEEGKKMAAYAARMAVDMQYGAFFQEAGLSPEVEQEVREILERHLADSITAAAAAQGSGDKAEALKKIEENAKANLQTALREVLNRDELAAWEAYEETKEERMLAQSYTMQLTMFAPGLSEENREIAQEVLVEETLAAGLEGGGMQSGADMAGQLESHMAVFDRARERLATALDEEQMEQFDRFVERQREALDMFANMMGQKPQEDEK